MILENNIDYFKRLNNLGCLVLVNIFQKMGIFQRGGEDYSVEGLKRKLGIIPGYYKLFEALLHILEEEIGLIEIAGNEIITSEILDQSEFKGKLKELQKEKQKIMESDPDMKPYAELLWVCLENYSEILQGNILATDIIFPGSSMELVDRIYKDNPIADYFNNLVVESIEIYIKQRISELAQGEIINIIEIGAGTGGTSDAVLKAINKYGKNLKYVYSDLSPAFLLYGKKHYQKKYPFIEFSVLDIEKYPASQGYEMGSYDIVLGANVLHATKAVKNTLKNVKYLLKPYGWLLLNELTSVNYFTTFTFGLLDGWWLSEDSSERIDRSPLLSCDMWEFALKSEGFNNAVVLKSPENVEDLSFQSVIISESDGVIDQRTAKKGYEELKVSKDYNDEIGLARENTDLNSNNVNVAFSQHLKKLLIETLQISEAAFSDSIPLWDYGVDSILASQIANKVNKSFGVILQTTDLFNYSTTLKLADYIISEFTEEIKHWYSKLAETHNAGNFINIDRNKTILKEEAVKKPYIGKQDSEFRDGKTTNLNLEQNSKKKSHHRGIAIIGFSGIFPASKNPEDFWDNLINGVDCVTEIPSQRWDYKALYSPNHGEDGKSYCNFGGFLPDVSKFDPLFFNLSPKQAELMDPRQRLFLQEAWKTIEDAGLSDKDMEGKHCGVFVGCEGSSDYCYNLSQDYSSLSSYNFLGNSNSILASRISYHMDLKGPSVTIDTACSSSMVAVHLACESIWNGDCEMAIAGGVQVITESKSYVLMCKMGMLSPDGKCYAFDNNANGFVPCEAVGAILLKPVEAAQRDGDHIYSVIVGSGINQDGKSNGITAPNSIAQIDLECSVYDKFDINPETISYVEAHGTGTKIGDPIEIEALSKSFRKYTDKKQYCFVGSAKANVGHAGPAAGIVSIIKVLQVLKHRKIPPVIHYKTHNKHINFENSPFRVNTEQVDLNPQNGDVIRVAISGFGHSGTNCHIVMQEPPNEEESRQIEGNNKVYIFPLSAKSEDVLLKKVEEFKSWLDRESKDCCIADIAYTLQVGRSHFSYRAAVVAASIEELRDEISVLAAKGVELSQSNISIEVDASVLMKEASDLLEEIHETKITPQEYKKNITELAELYLKGYDFDWHKLYKGMNLKRISLPTYPFADEEFWVSKAKVEPSDKRANDYYIERLHSMIDFNASTLREEKFVKRLTGYEKYLSAHVVAGQKVLPGVAYIEMARAAGELAGEKKVVKLKEIFWIRPIRVEDTSKDVEICIFPENDFARFEIYSVGEDRIRLTHAQGKLIYEGNSINNIQLRKEIPSDIFKRCANSMDPHKCYEIFDENGVHYGEYFKSICKLNFNNEEAIAHLKLTDEAKTDLDNYILHPSILDGAIQTAIGLVAAQKVGKSPLLPFSLEEIYIFSPVGKVCYAHVCTSTVQGGSASGINMYNINLLDEEGNTLVFLKNFTVRELKDNVNASAQSAAVNASSSLFYSSVWREVPKINIGSRIDSGNILIMHTESTAKDLLDTYIALSGASNVQVCLVKPGNSFMKLGEREYQIRSDSENDYMELVKELAKEKLLPDRIIVFWGHDMQFSLMKDMNDYLRMSFYPVYNLTRSLMRHKVDNKIQIISVYGASDENKYIQIEALGGFARTIASENPNFLCKTIGISLDEDFKSVESIECLNLIMSEFSRVSANEFDIRFKEGKRFVKFLQKFDTAQVNKEEQLIKDGKVYLITGGAGGLGLIFAKYIASKARVKVVLSGRSTLEKELEKRIESIKCDGSEIIYIKGDVSSLENTEQLVREVKIKFGRLDGIIHSAGVIKDSYLVNKELEEVDYVLGPKVRGTINLDIATGKEKLDFFVCFSSISSVIGNAGQSDYCYANSFMNCFAEYREMLEKKGERTGKTISIAWPLWLEGGMEVNTQSKLIMDEYMGLIPMNSVEGIRNFEYALKSGTSSLAIFYGNDKKISSRLELKEKQKIHENSPESEMDEIMDLMDDTLLYKKAEMFFKEILSTEIKLPVSKINSQSAFEVYGIDSIIILNLNKALENHFGQLSKTLFFEYKNVEEITNYFIKKHREKLVKKLGVEVTEKKATANLPVDVIDDNAVNYIGQRRFQAELHIRDRSIEDKDIAIIGIAGRYPMADNIEQLWSNLLEGKDCITEIPRERWDHSKYFDPNKGMEGKTYSKWGGFINDVDKFDPLFFNISPREVELMDPQERLFLETVWQTLEDAGYTRNCMEKFNVGVFVGVMYGDYRLFGPEESLAGNPVVTRSSYSSIANRISYYFNLYGPSIAVDTMCSSSLTSIHLACESILRGETDMAIAGGVNLTLHQNKYLLLGDGKFASSDGRCRSFGEGGDGYVPGEGIGAVLLKPLKQAVADGDNIHAVIKGTSINHGGKTNGYTVPNPAAQSDLILQTIEKSGVNPGSISYIEAHGTGTSLGDPIEITGLVNAFSKYTNELQFCPIGSIKSNIGHLESAAGIASITKVILQMKHRKIVPSIHSGKLNSNISFKDTPFFVPQNLMEWNRPVVPEGINSKEYPRIAGISAFGAGGSNAHIILEEYRPDIYAMPNKKQGPYVFVFSSKNEKKLKEDIREFLGFIGRKYLRESEQNEDINLSGIAYTLQVGREEMEQRLGVIAANLEELAGKLERYLNGETGIEDLFEGNTNDQGISDLLFEDEEGQNYIKSVINGNKLNKIAQLWVKGLFIPWNTLYGGFTPRRTSLPGYKFEKERHWIKRHVFGHHQFNKMLHPLIDEVVPSLEKGVKFRKTIGIDHPIVQDHKVQGVPVFPGVGYVEMAYAAGLRVRSEINSLNIVWLKPIFLESEEKVIQIFIDETENLNFEIQSFENDNVIVHAKGSFECGSREDGVLEQYIPIEEIRSRYVSRISRETLYEKFNNSGISYGPYFQGVCNVCLSESDALCEINLPETYKHEMTDFILHPSLMDGALQAAAGLIERMNEVKNKPMLPFAIENIEIMHSLTPKAYAYVTTDGENRYNIAVLDDKGLVCVKLYGVSFRKIKEISGSFFYIPKWVPDMTPSTESGNSSVDSKGKVVFITRHMKEFALLEKLKKGYLKDEIIEIVLGEKNKQLSDNYWEIRCGEQIDWDNCIGNIGKITTIYFLSSVENEGNNPEYLEALEHSQEYGVFSLFGLIKALNKYGLSKTKLDLKIITNDVNSVHNEKIANPYAASIYGFINSLSKEYPQMKINCFDVSLHELIERPAELSKVDVYISSMMGKHQLTSGSVYAFRNGKRYKTIIKPLVLPKTEEKIPFKSNGVYIIIGGAGGIGLEFAHYLSSVVQANVVLTGRRDYAHLKVDQKQKIEELNAKGGKILYMKADIEDIDSMYRVVSKVKEEFGKINGVIHSAIVLKDKTLANMDKDTLSSVLNPKVKGSVVLFNVLKYEQIDFVLFFSSAQSYTGNIGQSNYAAACSFEDTYAKFMNAQMNCDVKVINWGYWGTVGIVANEDYNKSLADKGIKSITPKEGMQAVRKVVLNPASQVIAIKAEDNLMELIGANLDTAVEIQQNSSESSIQVVYEDTYKVAMHEEIFQKRAELEMFQRGMKAVENLACSLVLKFFRNMGVLRWNEKYKANDLMKKVGIVSDYRELYEGLLDILKYSGAIRINDDEIFVSDNSIDMKEMYNAENVISDYPEMEPYVRLLCTCLESYPEVLSGKKSYAEVMFPGNSMALVENIYRNNTLVDYYNNLVASVVKHYIKNRIGCAGFEKINIVEIGAGTGGTSTFVLKSVAEFGEHINYSYTDISKVFTEYGKSEFGNRYSFADFRVLDIEKDPMEQGMELGSVDIVFGTNVFHATRNISDTINNAKKMLKANGLFIVNEVVQVQIFTTLTFGLTKGWWLFMDGENRMKGSPLLSEEQWKQVMDDSGIFNAYSINSSGFIDLQPVQSVIFGESDGMYCTERIRHAEGSVASNIRAFSDVADSKTYLPSSNSKAYSKEAVEAKSLRAVSCVLIPTAYENINEAARDYVKSVFSEILKVDKDVIDGKSNFEKYGVDSLMVTEITKKFEKDFGKLPSTLLFEYISVDALTEYFVKNHSKTLEVKMMANTKPTLNNLDELFGLGSKKVLAQNPKVDEVERDEAFEETANESKVSDIAIIGVSGRYPLAENLDEFWDNLILGKNCVSEIPKDRWDSNKYLSHEPGMPGKMNTKWGGFIKDIDKFDPLFFNISTVEAKGMDPQERLFLETAWSTFEDAGYKRSNLKQSGNNVGVFVGVMNGNYALLGAEEWGRQNPVVTYSSHWSVANRVSYFFDLNGPSLSVDTACSSSLTAIHLACESIKNGECEMALAGGVNIIIHPLHYIGLCNMHMLSDGSKCKAFGDEADGFIDGEGVGAVLLKPLDKAIEDGDRIYAVIKGSAINSGGKTSGYTVPNPNAQANVITNALKKANIDPRTISYIEAHGTGTSLGDPIEITGLSKAFKDYTADKQFCAIGSVKSNIGHLESAAGIAGLTKVLLQLKNGQIVPSINSTKANPKISFEETPFYIQKSLEDWKRTVISKNGINMEMPRRAGLSSFGAGGSNAHLIIEEFIESRPQNGYVSNRPQLFVISAKTESSLKEYAGSLTSFLEKQLDLSEISESELHRSIHGDVIDLVCDILKVGKEEINSNEDLSEYGFDRMALTSFSERINQTYGLELTMEFFFGTTTLESLIGRLVPELNGKLEENINYGSYYLRKSHKGTDSLEEIAYNLQAGREEMPERLAVIATSIQELVGKLKLFVNGIPIHEDVFRGKVRNNSIAEKDILDLSEFFVQRNLRELAKAWIEGVKVNWEHLYDNKMLPKKAALPTYPFAKERYWVNIAPQKNAIGQSGALHPFIDKIMPAISIGNGVVFQKKLKRTDPVVADHKISGMPVFPAAGYLEMAFAVASEVNAELTAFQIIWLQPLTVDSDQIEIHIHVYEEQDELNCEIKSVRGLETVTHAKVIFKSNNISVDCKDTVLDIVKSRCNEDIDPKGLKGWFNSLGIQYGPYFRGVRELKSNAVECLGIFELPADLSSEIEDYKLSPVLMDGIFQAIAGFASRINKDTQRMLPFSIETVQVLKPLSATCYAHITLEGGNSFNVSVFDEHHNLCMILREITFREASVPVKDFVYAFNWQSATTPELDNDDINCNGAALIVCPAVGLKLAESLKRVLRGKETAEIIFGSDYNFSDSVRQLNETGVLRRIDTLYFMGGLLLEELDTGRFTQFEEHSESGVLALFRLIKELDFHVLNKNCITVKVVTNFVHVVGGGQSLNPYAGSIHGLTKVLASEYPQLNASCIDVDLSAKSTDSQIYKLAQMIEREVRQQSSQDVAIRYGQRYVRKMHRVLLPNSEMGNLREGGVYLILGGAGGIGLELSRYLCEKVRAKVVLIGRSALNESKKVRLDEINAEAGEILYLRADITNYQEMQQTVTAVKAKFGTINGVFHSAVVLKRDLLKEMDEETFRTVLEPKTIGSIILYKVFENEPLDFMFFFSSIQSFLGNSGQGNYAAASCFEDAFASYINQEAVFPVKTINWGYWDSSIVVSEDLKKQMSILGTKKNEEFEQYLGTLGFGTISPSEGLALIGQILSSKLSQIAVVKGERDVLEKLGIDEQAEALAYQVSFPSLYKQALQYGTLTQSQYRRISDLESAFHQLERIGCDRLISILKRIGVFDIILTRNDLREQLRVSPKYTRQFDCLWEILERAGMVDVDKDCVDMSREIQVPIEYDQSFETKLEQLIQAYPVLKDHARLLMACIDNYLMILKGEILATDILFQNSSTEMVEKIYRGNEMVDYFNDLVVRNTVEYIRCKLNLLERNEKIKILEVGAGTGGTTKAVLEAVSIYAEHVSYVFTDLSATLVQYAKKQFSDRYLFMNFEILDVETNPLNQGFRPGDFDIVIAANVLHATKDMRTVIQNVKQVLKTNGWLIINEATQNSDFLNLTFGLLDGWWLYDDKELRINGSPLLSNKTWKHLLKENGFDSVTCLGYPDEMENDSPQHVVIAESDGVLIKELQNRQYPKNHHHTSADQVGSVKVIKLDTLKVNVSHSEDKCKYLEQKITECLSLTLEIEQSKFALDIPFADYGVDSILAVKIIAMINEKLEVKLRTTDLFSYATIESLAKYIEETFAKKLGFLNSGVGLEAVIGKQSIMAKESIAYDENIMIEENIVYEEPIIEEEVISDEQIFALLKRLERGELEVDEADRLTEELL